MKTDIEWNRDAAVLWKQFLTSETGVALFSRLQQQRPLWPLRWEQPEEVALAAARIAGYEQALAELLKLADEKLFDTKNEEEENYL